MSLRDLAADWLFGCRYLLTYGDIPGYRRLPWREKKRLDHAAAFAILRSTGFWRGAFGVAAATVLMYAVTWRFDLVAAPRDLLRVSPTLLSLPWLMVARRREIRMLLHFREMPHRQNAGIDR
jgi:hypothetical protein